MPEKLDSQTDVASEGTESVPQGSRFSLAAKIKLLLFALAVVVVECVAAYLYIPAASDAQPMADGRQADADLEAGLEGGPQIGEDRLEVLLGDFTITSYQPISETTLRVDFTLYGTIDPEEDEPFRTAMKQSENRIRDQVNAIVRNSKLNDLTDAGLGSIKRQILARINRMLGKPYLEMVIFSDFSFLEQ